MGAQHSRSVVLDAGALIGLESGDRRLSLLVQGALDAGEVVVPAGVVGQVWREGGRRARIARALGDESTIVDALDEPMARVAGVLCGRSGTDDVIDASVVIAARRHDAVVITTDAADLARLDPGLAMYAV